MLLQATVYYNSAGITISEQKVLSEFNYYYEGEQYTCSGFDLSNSTDSDAIPTTIRIVACYYYEANTAFFDSICLVKSNDVYDYTTSSGDDLEPDDPYTYYNDGSIATFTDENGTVYYYTYDSLGNLLSRLTAFNVGDHYTYYYYDKNNDGINDSAVTATETFEDGSQYIYTYYSDWTLYTETEKNAIGNIVSVFTYNTDGTISSEQTETGTVYNYTYDSMGNLLSKLTSGNVGDTYYYQYFDFNGDGVNESSKVFYEGFENGDWNYYIYNGNGILTTKYESKNGKTLIYSYDTKGNITSVQHNSFNYNYIYDVFGKPTSVNVGSQPLVTYNYRANNGSLQSVTYGNGSIESYTFNAFGELESKTQSGLGSFSYRYDSQGNPLYETDTVNNQKTFYHLDDNGNKVGEKVYTTTQSNAYANQLYSFVTIPDDEGRTVKNEMTAKGETISTPYTYTDFSNGTSQSTSALTSIRIVTSNYDEDGRITSRSLSTGTPVTESFTYTNNNGVLSHTIGSDQYAYTYDDNGNIIEIKKNNVLRQSYEYDADGQLTRENNLDTNKTVVYTYDNGGNITQKQEYAYTTGALGTATATINYSYDSTWKDKLTNYNGQSISYDAIGNPTTYRGATATWFGRQMQSYTKGSTAVTYKYDSDGLRTQKTVNGKVYDYYYVDGSLVYEKRGSEYEYFYCYDADGRLAMVKRIILASGAVGYFYVVTNAQGDVIELRDGNGNVTAKYTYDSWGKLLSITNASGVALASDSFAHQISVRYRGYYYDTETGLYYLQSRYYDPETGRFFNSDDAKYLGINGSNTSYNMFVYCENEPVLRSDSTGTRYDEKITYSPTKALAYAQKWWNSRNPDYFAYSGKGGDCANFLSQCLFAGGLKMDETWYSYSSSAAQTSWSKQIRNIHLTKTVNGFVFVPAFMWFKVSKAWSLAKELCSYLVSKYECIKIKSYDINTLKNYICKGKIKEGNPAFLIKGSDVKVKRVHHSTIIGKISSDNCYFYAHTNNRNAEREYKKKGIGLIEELNDNESIIIIRMDKRKAIFYGSTYSKYV